MTKLLAEKDKWRIKNMLLIQSFINSQNKGATEIDFTSGSMTIKEDNDQDMLFWRAIIYGAENGDIAIGGTEKKPTIDFNNDGVFDISLEVDEENKCFILMVISNEIGDSFDYKLSDTALEELKASCELGGIEEYYDTFKLIFSGNNSYEPVHSALERDDKPCKRRR